MYYRLNKQPYNLPYAGFALATVLIASFSMMLILLASVSATVAIRSSITEQYYSKLAKTASDAGVEYAKACLAVNDGKPQWSGKNLTPGTDCKGDRISGAPDYVYTDGEHIRSTFLVSGTGLDEDTRLDNISVSGGTDLINSSQTDPVWRKYEYNAAVTRKPIANKWLSVSSYSSCAPSSDNGVYCWGTNQYGLLGSGITNYSFSTSIPSPVAIPSLGDDEKIVTVTSGYFNICIRTNVSSSNKGYAYCWGRGNNGQLGNNSTIESNPLPAKVGDFSGSLLQGVQIDDIKIGYSHACALVKAENKLFCWGNNIMGQLGIGTSEDANYLLPVLVNDGENDGELLGKTIMKLSLDGNTTCVKDVSNIGYCWGDNSHGQTGTNTPITSNVLVPTKIKGELDNISLKTLTTGATHSCAITNSSNLAYCWGGGDYGQLGDGKSGVGYYSLLPSRVVTTELPDSASLYGIDLGLNSGCLIYKNSSADTTKRLACFGYNQNGKLGVGDFLPKSIPTKVSSNTDDILFDKDVFRVSVAIDHTCALAGEEVYCWGSNDYLQLGKDAAISESNIPLLISQPPISNYY